MIYGGLSPECLDYCADVWVYPLKQKLNDSNYDAKWQELSWNEINPGKRWKSSLTYIPNREEENEENNDLYRFLLFGGHRLWHGFAQMNSVGNMWNDTSELPKGGFLNDLWEITLNTTSMVLNSTEITGIATCWNQPGPYWEDRYDVKCDVFWPPERSGHAAAFIDNQLYIYYIYYFIIIY